MRIRMTKLWKGWHGGVCRELHPGVIVEGGWAEIVHATQPGWCVVLPEPEPEPAVSEPELPILVEEVIPPEELPTVAVIVPPVYKRTKEVDEVRPFFLGPPADKMLDGADVTAKTAPLDLATLPRMTLAHRAFALGITDAFRMKKADLIRLLAERGA